MNPANRLCEIFDYFAAAPNTEIQAVWTAYLQAKRPLREEELISITQAVKGEISAIERRLADLGLEPELFTAPANHLRTVFSPLRYTGSWGQFMNAESMHITRIALLWARWALSQFDENDLPDDQVLALKESLAAQEALLSKTKLPFALRELLECQVREIKIAMLLYKVSGTSPLVNAVNKQVGEMNYVSDSVVKEYEDGTPEVKTAVEKGTELIMRAAKVAEAGSSIFKFGEGAYKYGRLGFDLATKLLT